MEKHRIHHENFEIRPFCRYNLNLHRSIFYFSIYKNRLHHLFKRKKIKHFLLFTGISLAVNSSVGEINSIKEQLEKQWKKKLPVDARYSDNIYAAFAVPPIPKMFLGERSKYQSKLNAMLKLKELKDCEIEGIESSKYIIFIPRTYKNYPTRLYGALWEELGEIVASTLGVENKATRHGIGLAYRFGGLLQSAKQEKFSLEEAVDQVELNLKKHKTPFAYISHLNKALEVIRKYNPDLKFRIVIQMNS